jgi:molybdenum cofactor cytidylyltransferase
MGTDISPSHPSGAPSAPPPATRLTDLWHLGVAEVISLVGAGGKSSLMEAIAADYEAEGLRVLLTTTTKVRRPSSRPLIVGSDLPSVVEAVRASFAGSAGEVDGGADSAEGLSPLLGRGVGTDGKVEGIPTDWVPALRDVEGVAGVVVEADGSLGLPLKAAAEWEPVVPPCSSLVVSLAGLDAQGVLLDDRHVHRASLLAARLGLEEGSPIPASDVLRAAIAYETSAPRLADFIVFLNKVDLREPEPGLVDVCSACEYEVWSGSVGPVDPSGRSRRLRRLDAGGGRGREARVSAVVLAAGLATRMRGRKVTATFGDTSVVGRVVRSALESSVFDEIVVVAGTEIEDVEKIVAAETVRSAASGGRATSTSVRVERNDAPAEGMASSLQVGVDALERPGGVLVLLGDQPLLGPELLRLLMRTVYESPRAAAVGVVGGGRRLPGPPVYLHRSLLPKVRELRGDEGARRLIEAYASSAVSVEVDPHLLIDVDRPEDLDRARDLLAAGESSVD